MEFWLCANTVFFFHKDFQWKALGFVVVSFLINPRPTPRILWNSGFVQVLLFFHKDFQDAYVGHLEKP